MIEKQGAAILSCDPGRDQWNTVMGTFWKNQTTVPSGGLYLYRYDARKYPSTHGLFPIELQNFADESKFHPLGIEFQEISSTLIVVNHHFEGARIEIFKVDITSHQPVARHTRTLIDPLIKTPNSISALNEHEFFVSNDHYFRIEKNPILAKVETYGAIPLGNIVYVHLHNDTSASLKSVVNMPYPNGITLLNDSMLAVAATSSCQFQLFNIRSDKTLELTETVRVPMMPDNLSTDQKGKLLISGHPHPPTLDNMVKDRTQCLERLSGDVSECLTMSVPSCVIEWTEADGIKTLYRTAAEFGSSSTSVRDNAYGLGLITGLYERGIMVWRE
ncbi:paraoxonase [Penicillium cinerascens]|uniref:Paraoxonase n=1 Tax=Penicillium cinerascens TaxID=70096 RepID=A0A9W9T0N7_9EURO|nr:paraoxonase [Penicillium cinerascens]KAJ5204876.1 paraoxonase [Penicillium cinerascens]